MGLLDKMKNMFTEEIEEEPIKSEVIQVEIPAPTKAEPVNIAKENSITDNPSIKKEEKTTPIFFDDEYFKELEKPKQEVKSSYKKEIIKPKEEKKVFKPTPIISPVYGVLDKNYNKEDIKAKREKKPLSSTNTQITVDDVRKKAFGTLEDDLETTLFGNNSILFNDVLEKEDDLLDDLIEDKEEIDIVEDDKPVLENELFDIIDTMYEKGEQS